MRTSFSHPLYVNWLPLEGDTGALGMTLCPGKHQPVSSTGAWDRQLDVDVQALVDDDVHRLVTLVTDEDMRMLRVEELPAEVVHRGLAWHHLPFEDTTAPDEAWLMQAEPVYQHILSSIPKGERVVVHCMGGLSRAGTFTSIYLWLRGMDMDNAIQTVRVRRSPHAINPRQEAFLHCLARDAEFPQWSHALTSTLAQRYAVLRRWD